MLAGKFFIIAEDAYFVNVLCIESKETQLKTSSNIDYCSRVFAEVAGEVWGGNDDAEEEVLGIVEGDLWGY